MMAAINSAKTIAKPALAADLQDQFHRQQRDDAEGNSARREQHPEQVEHPDQTTAKFAGSALV